MHYLLNNWRLPLVSLLALVVTVANCETVFAAGESGVYIVPESVTCLSVKVVGGKGADNDYADGGFGGAGASVEGFLSVAQGSTLYVYVGTNAVKQNGGFTGDLFQTGGNGGLFFSNAGGGGGASLISTCNFNSTACTARLFTNTEPRLVVAAGGGGGGGAPSGCNGGSGGGAFNTMVANQGPEQEGFCKNGGGGGNGVGGSGRDVYCHGRIAVGGGGGSLISPGAGGVGDDNNTSNGAAAEGMRGGDGYPMLAEPSVMMGGGGGGGFYGGGGGGSAKESCSYGAGGGAGSSYINSASSIIISDDASGTPSVTLAPTAASKCRGCTGVCADPHFTGLDGSRYDYMASPNRIVSLISDRLVQINSRFIRYQNTTKTVLGPTCARMCNETVFFFPNGSVRINNNGMPRMLSVAAAAPGADMLLTSPALVVGKLSRSTVRLHIGSWRMSVQMTGTNINLFDIVHLVNNDSQVHGAFGITAHPEHHTQKKQLCQPRDEGACELPGRWEDYELAADSDLCSTTWTYQQFEAVQCSNSNDPTTSSHMSFQQRVERLQQQMLDLPLASRRYKKSQ